MDGSELNEIMIKTLSFMLMMHQFKKAKANITKLETLPAKKVGT